MKITKLTTLALALAAAFQTQAQTTDSADLRADLNRVTVKSEALEDSRDAAGFKGLKISGYLDPVYIYNYNQKRAGFQFVVPVATEGYAYYNSYFGTASIDFLKETDSGTRYHLNLIAARSTGDVMGSLGNLVHEATVSVPLTDSTTRLIAGQVPDWSGDEYLQPTTNKLITHNLLFDYTLPSAYTGAGLELTRGKWIVKGMLGNVNTPLRQPGELAPALAFRADYSATEFGGFGFAGVLGTKANYRATGANPITGVDYSTKDTWFKTLEVDGWYTRGDLTMATQLTYGMQDSAAITADPVTGNLRAAKWAGVNVMASYKFTPRLEGVLRGDFIYNRWNGGGLLDYVEPNGNSGIGPDPAGDPEKGANRFAVSAGVGYAFNTNTTFKFEYRYDGSDLKVFQKFDATMVSNNHLLGATVVVSF